MAEKILKILKRAHLHLHLLTFVDDQPQLQVGQKPLLLILRWRRPTLVQVAGGKGAAKRSGWRDPPTSGWWVVGASYKQDVSVIGGRGGPLWISSPRLDPLIVPRTLWLGTRDGRISDSTQKLLETSHTSCSRPL